MQYKLSDILEWIETPKSFRNGLGEQKSPKNEELSKKLFSEIFEQLKSNWVQLDKPDLEKALDSMTGIQLKLKSLVNHFGDEVQYLENNQYENIGLPHPWDFFLPEGMSEEKRRKHKKLYEDQVKRDKKYVEYVNKNKGMLLHENYVYLNILDVWMTVVDDGINLLKKRHMQSSLSPKTNKNLSPSTYLKPINTDNTYNGLIDLMNGLSRMGLIDPETSIVALRRLFGFGIEKVNKILWTGPINALHHFIKKLEEQKKIHPLEKNKAKTVSRFFMIKDKPDFDFTELRHNNGPYAKIDELKSLILNL